MEIEAAPNWLCKQKTISIATTADTLDNYFRQYSVLMDHAHLEAELGNI